MGIVIPGVTKFGREQWIHVGDGSLGRGELKRLARGLGLYLASAVQADGKILGATGDTFFIENGVCYQVTQEPQVNSFTREISTIEKTTECKGHLVYKNVGSSDSPSFRATGEQYMRCKHQYAAMIAAGFLFTFSAEAYREIVLTEISQRHGDADAKALAAQQIAEWRENGRQRFEARKAVAMATQHERNVQGLAEGELLPANTSFLELPYNGATVKDAVIALKGQRFMVEVLFQVQGMDINQRLRARNLNELASRVAPIMATARQNDSDVVVTAVEAA